MVLTVDMLARAPDARAFAKDELLTLGAAHGLRVARNWTKQRIFETLKPALCQSYQNALGAELETDRAANACARTPDPSPRRRGLQPRQVLDASLFLHDRLVPGAVSISDLREFAAAEGIPLLSRAPKAELLRKIRGALMQRHAAHVTAPVDGGHFAPPPPHPPLPREPLPREDLGDLGGGGPPLPPPEVMALVRHPPPPAAAEEEEVWAPPARREAEVFREEVAPEERADFPEEGVWAPPARREAEVFREEVAPEEEEVLSPSILVEEEEEVLSPSILVEEEGEPARVEEEVPRTLPEETGESPRAGPSRVQRAAVDVISSGVSSLCLAPMTSERVDAIQSYVANDEKGKLATLTLEEVCTFVRIRHPAYLQEVEYIQSIADRDDRETALDQFLGKLVNRVRQMLLETGGQGVYHPKVPVLALAEGRHTVQTFLGL